MRLELTKEEIKLLSWCATSRIDSIMESLISEEASGKYTCNRYDNGHSERSVLEDLVATASLLLKITEEVK
tara:strand:- start:366 stop:578 length:213 start_codon:yes stop_codon:yes gene_type:complete